MKKFYLLLFFLSMGLSGLFAANPTVDYTDANGAVWTFEKAGIWNTGTQQYDYYWSLKSVTNYGDDITVPSSVTYNEEEYSVERIGCNVFKDNKSVTRIILSSSIKRIESEAFSGCSSLKDIGDLSHCEYISFSAFYNCLSLEEVDLSSCVTIEWGAFNGCRTLQDIGSISKLTSLGSSAFSGCKSLKQVDFSASVSIDNNAFYGCSNLQSVGSLSNAIIESYAFSSCTSLKIVDLSSAKKIGEGAFCGCFALENVGDLSAIKGIDKYVFQNCPSLKSVDLTACKSIGEYAFSGCSCLTEVNLAACQTLGASAFSGCPKLGDVVLVSTSLSSIGDNAFNHAGTLTLMSTTPPTVGSLGDNIIIKVPAEALAAYQAADGWKDMATRIFGIGDTFSYTVETTAKDASSGIHELIGEDNLGKVADLTVNGTINSYDIMIMRNKMPNLHYLDLTNAKIVDNSYEYYTGCHSENDVIGTNCFRDLTKLLTVKLPNTIKQIGKCAFEGCSNLQSITMYEGIETICQNAFWGCSQLKSVTLPNGLITIGGSAFWNCSALENVDFPPTLETIGGSAFWGCNALKTISLPVSLRTIESNAFQSCSSLQEVKIPSSVTKIYDKAFSGCSNLTKVYTYTIEPTTINQTTFSNYTTADLYVPTTSYNNYYWDTEWSQFGNLIEFDEPYTYFYINKDYVLDNDRIDGTPDVDLNPGSSLTVEGGANQNVDDLNVISNGDTGTGASVIADNNINANWLQFKIEVNANKWYFFAFPFNILLSNIVLDTKQGGPGEFVFRYYDGAERANNGKGGWKNLPVATEELQKGQGYIFQCNKKGTLILKVQNPSFKAEDQSLALTAHDAEHAQDAGWNFIGNPYISYYDMNKTEYTAPITIWNGTSYEAIRPGDDEHHFHPFEAFFIQKPDAVSEIVFNKDDRTTYIKSQQEDVAAARGMTRTVDETRKRIELTISDTEVRDKTRIVFNQNASEGYETSCDAAKFLSSENVPQIYSLDNDSKYAINERPIGDVKLGYVAKTAGTFKIGAKKMETEVMLYDQVKDETIDLTTGDYSFETEIGTFENRFVIKASVGGGTETGGTETGGTETSNTETSSTGTEGTETGGNPEEQATGIAFVKQQTGVSVTSDSAGIYLNGVGNSEVSIYAISGSMLAKNVQDGFVPLPKATYIVKVNKLSTKLMVK